MGKHPPANLSNNVCVPGGKSRTNRAIIISMQKPMAASMRKVLRHPNNSTDLVNGVCAVIPPTIANVTINPTTSAMCFGGNQRDANRTQLNKQNDPPMPVIKRQISACHKAVVNENNNAHSTQKDIASKIILRTVRIII